MLAEDDRVLRDADGLRRHDLVGLLIVEYTVLMDAGLVCECVRADNRLGRCDADAGDGLDHAAGAVNLLGVDTGVRIKVILAGLECHDNLLHGGIAGALADAVDRALDLTDSCLNSCQRGCNRHAQIVVVVAGQDDILHTGDMLADIGDQRCVLLRRHVADGVRNIQCGRTALNGSLQYAAQEVRIGTGCILCGELDVGDILLCVSDVMCDTLQDIILGHAQLVLHMNRTGRNKGMDARIGRVLDCIVSGIDILLHRAGQRADRGILDRVRDRRNGSGISRRCDSKTGLDDINTQVFQLTGNLNLLREVHAAARRLLTVSERGIKNLDHF